MAKNNISAGIDFGTSNSSIGIWKDNCPNLLPLVKEETKIPTVIYTHRSDIEIEEIDIDYLKKRLATEKQVQTKKKNKAKIEGEKFKDLSPSELENMVRGQIRREIAERNKADFENQSIRGSLSESTEFFFGEEALRRHIEDPENGFFIKSPKSFLGSDLSDYHIDFFSEIISKILSFIKNTAEEESQSEIQNIVLGRPITFHGEKGEDGNKQAINILERAAIAGGFHNIEFLMEPIAAALDFERTISEDLTVLVLDAGGGTTDCSMVRLGPSYMNSTDRTDSVLGYAGARIGGLDLDIKLAFKKIMPHFGKESILSNGQPIPSMLFWNAVLVNDLNAHAQFLSKKTLYEINSYLLKSVNKREIQRLHRLQSNQLTFRLNRSAELAKIHLSDRENINLPLKYIEKDFFISLSRSDLLDSIVQELDIVISLMKETESQAESKPDIVYVTGGTAKSPILEKMIRSHYKSSKIVIGDSFGSVTSGLTTWAHRIYD